MKIDRRSFLALTASGITLMAKGLVAQNAAGPKVSSTAPYGGVQVDGCGSPAGFSLDTEAPLSDSMIDEVRKSGITCVNVTVGTVGNKPESEVLEGMFHDVGFWENEMDRHPDVFLKVKSVNDIALAESSGRLGLILGLQDGVFFQNDLLRLEMLRRFGVRIIQPTYNVRNLLGDGCMEPDDAGLSKAGQASIARMNELGILVDLSHCGRKTSMDAIAASKRPVAFTHTGCAAVCDHPRNKTDEQLRAIAEKGGVAGIYFMPYLRSSGQPTSQDLIQHLEHAIDVAGEDHVGLGTDGGIPTVQLTPEFMKAHKEEVEARKKAGIGAPGETSDVYTFLPDLNSNRRFEMLAGLLEARGHTQSRIRKILGENFVRVFRQAWVQA